MKTLGKGKTLDQNTVDITFKKYMEKTRTHFKPYDTAWNKYSPWKALSKIKYPSKQEYFINFLAFGNKKNARFMRFHFSLVKSTILRQTPVSLCCHIFPFVAAFVFRAFDGRTNAWKSVLFQKPRVLRGDLRGVSLYFLSVARALHRRLLSFLHWEQRSFRGHIQR